MTAADITAPDPVPVVATDDREEDADEVVIEDPPYDDAAFVAELRREDAS